MTISNQEDVNQQRIMLVDDHALFRAGLRLVLIHNSRVCPEIQEAGSVNEALAILREQDSPNLILLDIAMPGINGLSGLGLLRQACPDAIVAVLSASDDSKVIHEARALGADGFLSKESDAQSVNQAIDQLLDGQQHFPQLAESTTNTKATASPPNKLTPRQLEVLALLGEGRTNKVIARKLSISENTVRVHVSAILAHLGVTTRMEAVYAARSLAIMN